MKSNYPGIFVISLIISFLVSCRNTNNTNEELLKSLTKKVDAIEIFYYGKTDTLKRLISDKRQMEIITNLIDGKTDADNKACNPDGHILYFENNKIIFESMFSIRNDCVLLSYNISSQLYTRKLTYRAGMLLGEYSYGKLINSK